MHVLAALLNSEVDEENYMQQANGFACNDQPDMACKPRKSVYGLKQAARRCNKTIHQVMLIRPSVINVLKVLIQNVW